MGNKYRTTTATHSLLDPPPDPQLPPGNGSWNLIGCAATHLVGPSGEVDTVAIYWFWENKFI